ncbi:MAG: hypothetical protein K8U03_25075 [Planctomycetia bacterium]|nr:hypothetical protein [Planctomycetia bacterium]
MKPNHRHKLRYGPYAAPRFRYGSTANDACRGDVVLVAISDGRIPWPLGRVKGNSNRALVVYGGLVRAVRREASQAVAYWWGVTAQTVTKWRKALGVNEQTEGDRTVRAEHGRRNWLKVGPKPPFFKRMREAAARLQESAMRAIHDVRETINRKESYLKR